MHGTCTVYIHTVLIWMKPAGNRAKKLLSPDNCHCFYPTLCTVHVLCTYTQCLFDYGMRMTVTVTGWGVSSKLSCCTSMKTTIKIHPLYHACTHHWQEWLLMAYPSRFSKAGWTLLGKTEVSSLSFSAES